jgi:plasmid segregation protein ParM
MRTIGLDTGYGFTKVVDDGGVTCFPSVVGSYEPSFHVEQVAAAQGGVVTVDGQPYFVGDRALRCSAFEYRAQSRDWLDSVTYRALVIQALAPYPGQTPLRVITGLPVRYIEDRGVLAKVIRSLHKGIKSLIVIPQPFGTFLDLILDEQGGDAGSPLADQTVGIVDLGFFTTDFLLVDRLQPQSERMTGLELGLSTVCRRLEQDLHERFRLSLRLHQVDQVLRTKQIRVRGQIQDVSSLVEHRVDELARTLAGWLSHLRSDYGLDTLLLTGGGGRIVGDAMKEDLPVLTPTEPALANARGYWKYGKKLETQPAA